MATAIDPVLISFQGSSPMTPVPTDDVDGNTIANSPKLEIELHNTDTESHEVTITTVKSIRGLAVEDVVIDLPASDVQRVAGLDDSLFSRTVQLMSDSATVEVAAHVLA